MKPQFNNNLLTSFVLWADHKITNDGQGYRNVNGLKFFQQKNTRTGNCWASPYKSLVYDSSVSGANVPSGVYNSSGQFLTRESGITIDWNNGSIYSAHNWGGVLSGDFAKKEYNVYIANEDETEFLLEQIFSANSNIKYTDTGTTFGGYHAPLIIVTNSYENNVPFALGGEEDSRRIIRTFIVSSDMGAQEATTSLFTDSARSYFPLVSYEVSPLVAEGDLKGGYYNYKAVMETHGPDVFVAKVHSLRLNQKANKNKNFTIAISEFDLSVVRYPRTFH